MDFMEVRDFFATQVSLFSTAHFSCAGSVTECEVNIFPPKAVDPNGQFQIDRLWEDPDLISSLTVPFVAPRVPPEHAAMAAVAGWKQRRDGPLQGQDAVGFQVRTSLSGLVRCSTRAWETWTGLNVR